ncbi:hypothetical protein Tco_1266383 [Tanacetum coccineum]
MVSPATCLWGMSPGIILMLHEVPRGDGAVMNRPPTHVYPPVAGGWLCEKRQRSMPLTYPSRRRSQKELRRRSFQDRPCLTSAAQGLPPLDRDLRRHQHALAKSLQYQQGFFQGQALEGRPHHRDLRCGGDQAGTSQRLQAAEWDKEFRSLARLRDEMRQASDTQEYPSLIDTFWRTHTVDGVFPKDEDRRIYEDMKRLEATSEYTCKKRMNQFVAKRGVSFVGTFPVWVLGIAITSHIQPECPPPSNPQSIIENGSCGCGDDEESGDDEDGDGDDYCDESIQLSPATCRWGKVCHRGTNCLTEKRVGPTSSLGIIAGDCIPDEDSPATIPQRHFDGDSFPQRHVAGESPEMSLGKTRLL